MLDIFKRIVNNTGEYSGSLLMQAVERYDLETIKLCLILGADINYQSKAGYDSKHKSSALSLAVQYGCIELCRVFIVRTHMVGIQIVAKVSFY